LLARWFGAGVCNAELDGLNGAAADAWLNTQMRPVNKKPAASGRFEWIYRFATGVRREAR
jgi:hypothetical protein